MRSRRRRRNIPAPPSPAQALAHLMFLPEWSATDIILLSSRFAVAKGMNLWAGDEGRVYLLLHLLHCLGLLKSLLNLWYSCLNLNSWPIEMFKGAGEEGEGHLSLRLPLLHSFLLLQNAGLQIDQCWQRPFSGPISLSRNLALILAGSMDRVGLVLAATRAAIFTDTWSHTHTMRYE